MGRTVAVFWHASFSIIAAGLYFLFVLPRWWELTGVTPQVLGTVLRIVAAVLIGLAALPVVFTLLRTRKPEYDTPQQALRLLVGSIVAHVLAGVLIAGAAISEIWLSLDVAGQWLFGIYGAAAAIALLGIGAFYLSFVAELPPPPPKPLKPKKRRFRKKGKEPEEALEEGPEDVADDGAENAAQTETATAEDEAEAVETPSDAEPTAVNSDASDPELVSTGSRRKRRPSGKRRAKNS